MRRSRTALPFLSAEVRPHRDRAPGGSTWGAPGVRLGDTGGVTGRLRGIPGGNVPARRLRAAINVLMALGVNYPPNGLLIIIRPCVIARRLRGIFQRDPGGGGEGGGTHGAAGTGTSPAVLPAFRGSLGGRRHRGSAPRAPHRCPVSPTALPRRRRGRAVGTGAGIPAGRHPPPLLRDSAAASARLPGGPRARGLPRGVHHRGERPQQRRRGGPPPVSGAGAGLLGIQCPAGQGGNRRVLLSTGADMGGYQGYGGVTEPVSAPGNGQRPRGGGRGGGQRRPVPASRPGGDLAASPGIAAPLFWGRSRPPPPGPSPSGPAPAPVSPAVPPPHTDTCPRPGGGAGQCRPGAEDWLSRGPAQPCCPMGSRLPGGDSSVPTPLSQSPPRTPCQAVATPPPMSPCSHPAGPLLRTAPLVPPGVPRVPPCRGGPSWLPATPGIFWPSSQTAGTAASPGQGAPGSHGQDRAMRVPGGPNRLCVPTLGSEEECGGTRLALVGLLVTLWHDCSRTRGALGLALSLGDTIS